MLIGFNEVEHQIIFIMRFIFFYIVLLTATVTFAQTETAYEPPPPFDPYTNSYQYHVQKLYENLPLTPDMNDIPGTTALVEAELQKILSGKIYWEKTTPQNQSSLWSGDNLLPIGKHKIEVRNLNSDYYFWCIYGKIQLFVRRGWSVTTPQVPTKTIQNYVIILHFNEGKANAYIDFFTVGDAFINNNTQTLDKISKEATALLKKKNEEAYETVKNKNEWTINGKKEYGQFDIYRLETVTLTYNNTRRSNKIKQFSYNDQVLIRGYLDHQGIPIK
jgi:hypothetical protein